MSDTTNYKCKICGEIYYEWPPEDGFCTSCGSMYIDELAEDYIYPWEKHLYERKTNLNFHNMTKFYLDTEFIEYPGSIQLISIGIIAEDGESFYFISNEFDRNTASSWVKENVIAKLPSEEEFNRYPNDVIANELVNFIAKKLGVVVDINVNGGTASYFFRKDGEIVEDLGIEFWAYYADYDWVAFCWLFGTMMELPKGFPMYCHDLKQEMDRIEFPLALRPQQEDEHNALDDAAWNFSLHDAMQKWEAEPKAGDFARVFRIRGKQVLATLSSFPEDEDETELNVVGIIHQDDTSFMSQYDFQFPTRQDANDFFYGLTEKSILGIITRETVEEIKDSGLILPDHLK
jgi:hypothetical protein